MNVRVTPRLDVVLKGYIEFKSYNIDVDWYIDESKNLSVVTTQSV